MFILETGITPKIKLSDSKKLLTQLEFLSSQDTLDTEYISIFECSIKIFSPKKGRPNSIFNDKHGTVVYHNTNGSFSDDQIKKLINMFEKVAGKKPMQIPSNNHHIHKIHHVIHQKMNRSLKIN